MRSSILIVALVLTACSSSPSDSWPSSDAASSSTDSGGIKFGDTSTPETSTTGDGGQCDPPDMLILLDRSDSMKAPPSGGQSTCKQAGQLCLSASSCCSGVCSAKKCVGSGDAGASESKWALAVEAVDSITQAPTDTTVRFGLELLPAVSWTGDGGQMCGSGLLEEPLGLDNGAPIASTLSTTQLELGTPIGGALHVAQTTLAKAAVSNRKQYAILVTDGGETCNADGPLPIVQSLAASGIETFVVGFGGAVDAALLNDLACAGKTATSFSSSCTQTTSGWIASVPSTTHVFYDASDGAALKSELATITNGVCCGCNVPVN